jgi:peroxiredoxin Q/BCP
VKVVKDIYNWVGQKIPEFTLENTRGEWTNIKDFQNKKNVVILLIRGLMCPVCRQHLIRLAQDLDKFKELDTEVYVVTADRFENARRLELVYIKGKFPIYFDKEHEVVKLLKQDVKILQLGRLPAILIVDKEGIIQYAYYGSSFLDIPSNRQLIRTLKKIEGKEVG